jgi:hypothetical protein
MTTTSSANAAFRYPKLRPEVPVLERAGGEVQVGLDEEATLVFSEPRLLPVLRALDGAHHFRELRAAGVAAGLSADDVNRVLRVLRDARMLLEGGRGLPSQHVLSSRSVRLIGAGPAGHAVARLLAQSRLGHLSIVDGEPSDPELYPGRGPLTTRARALRAMLAEESAMLVSAATHWSDPSEAEADLTIIASDTVEADRLVADDLMRADQPHLVVRSAGDSVVVGPLVMPGRTACVRCTDFARRDADSAWPSLLDQLVRLRLPTTAALGAWAASVTTTQALAFLRGGTPEACGSTLELSERDLVMRWRSWTAHPSCGCHWFPATQWGA